MRTKKLSSIGEAVQQFRDAAISKSIAANTADDHNYHRQMSKAFWYLQSQGEGGRDAFDHLLSDDSHDVANWVAAQLLSEGRREAIPVMEAHSNMGGLFGFGAQIVISEFKNGRLGSPFGTAPTKSS